MPHTCHTGRATAVKSGNSRLVHSADQRVPSAWPTHICSPELQAGDLSSAKRIYCAQNENCCDHQHKQHRGKPYPEQSTLAKCPIVPGTAGEAAVEPAPPGRGPRGIFNPPFDEPPGEPMTIGNQDGLDHKRDKAGSHKTEPGQDVRLHGLIMVRDRLARNGRPAANSVPTLRIRMQPPARFEARENVAYARSFPARRPSVHLMLSRQTTRSGS